MKALYVHGYGSRGEPNAKTGMLQKFFEQIDFVDTQGGYCPECYASELEAIVESETQYDVIIGSSLGGFWAYQLASFVGKPCILFNPVTNPSVQLLSIDEETAGFYKAEFEGEEKCELPIEPDQPCLVLIADKDPVIPPQAAMDLFKGYAQIEVIDSDDHTMNSEINTVEPFIEEFLKERLYL